MRRIAIFIALLFFACLGFFLIEARYPASYSKLKGGMTEAEVEAILRGDHFVFQRKFLRHENVWVRKQLLGEWVVSCGFDKNRLWHTAFWYHIHGCGDYLRARNSSF